MQRKSFIIQAYLVVVCVFLFLSCASKPTIPIDYRLPAKNNEYLGQVVALKFTDDREGHKVIQSGAREYFKGFAGYFEFALGKEMVKGPVIGVYQVENLFLTAVEKRLANMGITVVVVPEAETSILGIVVNQFELDSIDGDWVVSINYMIEIEKEKQVLAKEKVRAKAERAQIFGNQDAYKVFSEIFTDAINDLNYKRLFNKVPFE